MSISDVLLGIAQDLNDAEAGYEFTIWSQEQLLRYYNEALCVVAGLLPGKFTTTVIVKVTVGVEEQDTCGCQMIINVLGQCTKAGVVTRQLRYRDVSTNMVWTGHKCVSSGGKLQEYSISGDKLFVYPPLAYGEEAYVKLLCSKAPTVASLTDDAPDMPCEMGAAVIQYVLFRAKSVDEMSVALRTASQEHYKAFQDIINGLQVVSVLKQSKSQQQQAS